MADPRVGLPIHALDTPSLLVDLDRLEGNISRMAEVARSQGVALRPHVKTHKVPAIAKMQLAAGAVGITVAKVSEAEVMVANGVTDIFIAYPIVTPIKARRVAALVKEKARIIVGVESETGADVLSAAAQEAGVALEVRLEVNTGLNRCGVLAGETAGLAQYVCNRPGLVLEGIYTFRGGSFPGSAGRSLVDIGREEGDLMAALARELRGAGLAIHSVSVGSTPTAAYCGVAGVTEIRPGTYVFNDNTEVILGVATREQVALSVLATVVSRQGPTQVTIDAGVKVFSGDVNPADLGLPGYGLAYDGADLVVARMNEEHGYTRHGASISLSVGDKVRLMPNHVCTSVNLSDELVGVRGDRVEVIWPVAARGKRE